MLPDPSAQARVSAELARIDAFCPILQGLGLRWAAKRPWEGLTVGVHLHLTTITLALLKELVLGGGRFVVSAANPATTDPGVVEWLRTLDIEVHSGRGAKDGIASTLGARPDLFADVGFALGSALLDDGQCPRGGVEITRSGVSRLRDRLPLPFPVLNINDGRLKPAIESRRGVGEGLWPAFTTLTGMHLAGRMVLVVGYGPVGAGVAAFARAAGATVEVAESDPVRRLIAHYDGLATTDTVPALKRARIVVTATGRARTLGPAELAVVPDGSVVLSAGHGGDEIDVAWLRANASTIDQIGARVVRYTLPLGRKLTVLADGHPLNIVMNSGSPEPVLLHFALLGLGLERLATTAHEPGEVALPIELEEETARAALAVLEARG
jgi:adenosylhomocysteinase